MSPFMVVVVSIGVAAFTVAMIYVVLTLVQIMRTVRQAEILLSKINSEVEKVGTVTSAVTNMTSILAGSMGKGVATGVQLALWMIRKFGQKPSHNHHNSPRDPMKEEARHVD